MWLSGVRARALKRDISKAGISLTALKMQAHRAAWLRLKTQKIIDQMREAP
jgi:competence transcription factor ComK